MKPAPDQVKSSPIVEKKQADSNWRNVATIVVSGYLSEPPHRSLPPADWRWRLYRTLALDEYLEFFWRDVVHIENVSVAPPGGAPSGPTDPLEPVVIWLGVNARVSLGDFLVGEVADMYMPHADLAASLGSQARAAAIFVGRSRAGCTRNPGCGE
jgi:hypothetical protein